MDSPHGATLRCAHTTDLKPKRLPIDTCPEQKEYVSEKLMAWPTLLERFWSRRATAVHDLIGKGLSIFLRYALHQPPRPELGSMQDQISRRACSSSSAQKKDRSACSPSEPGRKKWLGSPRSVKISECSGCIFTSKHASHSASHPHCDTPPARSSASAAAPSARVPPTKPRPNIREYRKRKKHKKYKTYKRTSSGPQRSRLRPGRRRRCVAARGCCLPSGRTKAPACQRPGAKLLRSCVTQCAAGPAGCPCIRPGRPSPKVQILSFCTIHLWPHEVAQGGARNISNLRRPVSSRSGVCRLCSAPATTHL